MLRAWLFVLLFAGCRSSGSKPPAEGSAAGSAQAASQAGSATAGSATAADAGAAPTSTGFARPLRGPFATLDAYCATRPKADDLICEAAEATPTGALPAGLLQAAAVYESKDDAHHDLGCAVALRTSAGWFVGPPSADTCREPSYIELEGVDVDTDEAIAAISFRVTWHTKDFDDEAKYKLTTLCTAGPACTPVFPSQCEAHAPVIGCGDKAFELTWTLDGHSATFKPDRAIDNDTVPTGKQAL